MSITTFANLITAISAKKITLVEISPSELLENWAVYDNDIYRIQIGVRDVEKLEEDGTELTEVSTPADITAGDWAYEGEYLYMQSLVGSPFDDVVVATYNMYFATEGLIFNDNFYEPFVASVPSVNQDKSELFWGVSIVSDGRVSMYNDGGFWDTIFESYAWENKPITVYIGGEDLAYGEYKKMFNGIVIKKSWSTSRVGFDFVDRKDEFESSLPFNLFNQTTYSDLHDDDVGKPIPHVWGSVQRMPVISTNRGAVQAVYTFKVADTSTHSISAISAAYVNNIEVTIDNVDLAAGTFGLGSAELGRGAIVSADVVGYIDGTVIENPIAIVEELGVLVGLSDADWDTDARDIAVAAADEASFECGLVVDKFGPLIDRIGDLMKSCMGNFFVNNDGLYSVNVWTPSMPETPDIITDQDVKEGTLKAHARTDHIRKVVRCGYRRQWDTMESAWAQETGVETERLYGITKSRSVPTLLSTKAGATVWLQRMILLFGSSTIIVKFSAKLQLAEKNIGDRFQIAFKRRAEEANVPWLNVRNVEIQKIRKDFGNSEISMEIDDLKGIGNDAGRWTADVEAFPDYLGGAAVTEWDDDWTDAQKAYAAATWGFWSDSSGLGESTDGETTGISKWW